jgi:hypothetical protein
MNKTKNRFWRSFDQMIFLEKYGSPVSLSVSPRLPRPHQRQCSSSRKTNVPSTPRPKQVFRPIHPVYIGADLPNRGTPDRPALVFQQETRAEYSSAARAMRRARPDRKSASQNLPRDAGRDDRHNAVSSELFHEQIQEGGSRSIRQARPGFHRSIPSQGCTEQLGQWQTETKHVGELSGRELPVCGYPADLAAADSRKPSMACFNCESTSSAMVITSSRTVPKSTLPRLFCRVLKMLTCRIRDSSTIMGAV